MQAQRPRMLMCYVCGREFGTTSLEIHQKQCEKKFIDEESKKPKGQRRELPKKVVMDNRSLVNATQEQKDEYNEQAYQTYKNVTLEACKHCGRTFKPESLAHHSKACTADAPFKPLNRAVPQEKKDEVQQNQKASKINEPQQNKSEVQNTKKSIGLKCYVCKQEFVVGMLMKHYKSCSESRKYTGNTPELFEDLKHLNNPTDKFISLYNKSVNEM